MPVRKYEANMTYILKRTYNWGNIAVWMQAKIVSKCQNKLMQKL